jgi:FlaA1/EpsC-like NDP-sugar epimerase
MQRSFVVTLPYSIRRTLVIAIHIGAIAVASYFAFWLRFDGAIPDPEMRLFFQTLPWLIAIRGITFIPFQLYEGLWRYTSLYDLRRIVIAVGVSSILFYCQVHLVMRARIYPRSVFIVDALLLIFVMGGTRLMYRTYQELTRSKPQRRVLIYGAGDAGEMIVRDMKRYNAYQPIGFVDDDVQKVGRRIHGVQVLGTRADLPGIVAKTRPHEVLVAIPRADPAGVRSIVKALETFKIAIRTLPNIRDLDECRVTVTAIRDLSIEDLMARAPVGLDIERIRDLVADKSVVVTGAGGSIGSELSRQIAALAPKELVLYERYENSLYSIANDLESARSPVSPVIGDVADIRRLNAVFEQYRPDVVFHAAAHKHVPLMELNICEAVKNNVTGTRRVGEAAQRYGVKKVVLISTDKAVNPSSVMGSTKRVAELILQRLQSQSSSTSFVSVRFGNVLGSNGSVVPRFLEQIRAGGPVTVTHPEMRRFFMLIPEAVQLVLHAAALGNGGGLYVLDMGEQIKLLDIARNLIRLSGFVPEEEIAITFTGPRPGEKLFEELVGPGESIVASGVDKVLRVHSEGHPNGLLLDRQVARLERYAATGDSVAVLDELVRIVPTFRTPMEETPVAVQTLPSLRFARRMARGGSVWQVARS